MPASGANPMNLGSQGSPKTIKKRCKKGRVKVEAQSETMSGLNLNPLAPAQSKRSFSLYGETRHSIENASIPAPFFCPCWYLFRAFSRKVAKGVQGPAPESQKDTKMDPKGTQTEPQDPKMEP